MCNQIVLFQNELALWENEVCDKVYDQIILNVTTRSPSDLLQELAEPCLVEHIHQCTTALRIIADNSAEECAINDSNEHYCQCVCNLEALKEQDLNMIWVAFDTQINEVKKNTQTQLQIEKNKAYQDLANFKAKLKAECEARKVNLANNRILDDPRLVV